MKHDYKQFASLFLALVILLYIPAIPSIAFTYSERDADWFDVGYNVGYSEGYDKGYEDGFGRGYEDSVSETYNSAYDKGYRDAYDDAYDEAYDKGYDDHGDGLTAMIGAIILGGLICRWLYNLYTNYQWKKRISK